MGTEKQQYSASNDEQKSSLFCWKASQNPSGTVTEKAPIPEPDKPAIRHITFWRNGFNVDVGAGQLMRYDDLANARILEQINAGGAPPTLLDVEPGQAVELVVVRRLTEDFVSESGDKIQS
ncbi:hypothetical protein FB45DRAFT_920470 [Roridomyces roridus]|uniref:SEP domain-containing protein n=1 Tax=Roridomyces roridus TaxID=1738132 RepID=A0AAD7BQC4_9AGAR|nr:hypothetical protein FB45DRAFT_920470 [Roridomyces roridus]